MMRQTKPWVITCTIVILLTSCATLGKLGIKPSALETISAVKDILNSSAFKAISKLSSLQNGVEGILPKEMQPILNTLKTVGYADQVNKVTKTIGDASSLVLKESSGIMGDVIKEVDLGDAVAIVLGGEDAATSVLKQAMTSVVKKRYSAALDAQLSKTDVKTYWPLAANAYNLFATNKVNPNLSDFLAEKAVDALFLAMGKEEKEIRKDPASIGSAVVNKVWDYYITKKGR